MKDECKQRIEELERILSQIANLVGCGHLDDNLIRCVDEAIRKRADLPRVDLQGLNDIGVNPFAIQLVYESIRGRIHKPCGFEFRGLEFYFQPASKSKAGT